MPQEIGHQVFTGLSFVRGQGEWRPVFGPYLPHGSNEGVYGFIGDAFYDGLFVGGDVALLEEVSEYSLGLCGVQWAHGKGYRESQGGLVLPQGDSGQRDLEVAALFFEHVQRSGVIGHVVFFGFGRSQWHPRMT